MPTDRNQSGIPRSLRWCAAALSLMLHGLLIGGWYRQMPWAPTPDFVVTVRLISSRPQVASKPAAAMPGPTAQDEEKSAKPSKAATMVRRLSDRAAMTPLDDAPTRASTRRRVATQPKSQPSVSEPRPDLPAVPSPPLDASDNHAQPSRDDDYAELLAQRLSRMKTYPALAVARGEEGVVIVLLDLDRSGHVISTQIVGTSGSVLLDDEVRQMVDLADPFPPFPASWDRAHAQFEVPITFELN